MNQPTPKTDTGVEKPKIPLKYRFWRLMHHYANVLAWKYARPDGEEWGLALRIDKTNKWWRLNDWCSSHYINWFVKNVMVDKKYRY